MNTINTKRLLKLAAFLLQLPRQKFNYDILAVEASDGLPMLKALAAREQSCGTMACAMGWTPAVFPRLVRFSAPVNDTFNWDTEGRRLEIESCSNPGFGTDGAIKELFGLTQDQADYLFYPGMGNGLGSDASAKQVARVIIKFVKRVEKRAALEKERTRLNSKLDGVGIQLANVCLLPGDF
jgi:hypothetical protein